MPESSETAKTDSKGSACKRSYLKLLWLLPLLMTVSAGFLFGRAHLVARNRPTSLIVDINRLDLGSNWSQRGFEWSLPITNTGDTDIEIVDFLANCTCTAIEPRKMVLRAGDSAPVHLTINLTPSPLNTEDRLPERPFEVALRAVVKTESLKQPEPWIIRGRIQNVLFTNPKQVEFDGADRVFCGSVPIDKTLSVTALHELREIRAEIIPRIAEVSVSKLADDGKTAQIVITPRTDLRPGPLKAALKIHAQLSSGERPPPVIVPISGKASPDVYAIPEVIQYAALAAGSLREGVISLASRRGSHFVSEPAPDQPAGISIRRFSKEPEDEHKYKIEIAVSGVGSQNLEARFIVSEAHEEPVSVAVQVVYYSLDGASTP